MTSWVAWAILFPLACGVIASLVGSRAARWVAVAATAGTACVAALVVSSVALHGPVHVSVGGWATPLGIELRADGFAAVMLAIIAIIATLLATLSIVRVRAHDRVASRFFSLWFFLWAALDALVLSSDIFNLYVTLELVTLAAVGLIAIGGDRGALRGALRYLLFALPGSLLYLLGVALLYGTYATLDLGLLSARVTSTPETWVALAMISVGLALKAALFPLHGWLPPVYTSARPLVSAMVSALVSKAAFFVLLRLWVHLFHDDIAAILGQLLGGLGAAAILWGSVLALRQPRLRLVIAYSSIAHIGYMFLWFALDTRGAWVAAVYLASSHAVAVASLFVIAGMIERAVGHDHLDGISGLAERTPLLFFALALAGINLMGMPPTGAFIGKWLLVRAAIETEQWWLLVVLVAGGLLAAGYVFRILRRTFLPLRRAAGDHPVPVAGALAALGLAVVGLWFGVLSAVVIDLLAVGSVR